MYTNLFDILNETMAHFGLTYTDLEKVNVETKAVVKRSFMKSVEINLSFDSNAQIINDLSYERRLAKAERFINNRLKEVEA